MAHRQASSPSPPVVFNSPSGFQPCHQGAKCPANVWNEHYLRHEPDGCNGCPALTCMPEHSVSNHYLFHAIKHFADVPSPERLLEVLLRRPWLSSAYGEALAKLWSTRKSPGCQPFSITQTTKAVLAAAPADHWQPEALLPSLALACLPETSLDLAQHTEALALLLNARTAAWKYHHLSPIIAAALSAQTDGSPASYEKQKAIISLLLDHVWPPAGPHPTAWIHAHIKTGLLAGVSAQTLDLLLSRAPHWRPDELRDLTGQGVLYTWVRECGRYQSLFPVIAAAAVSRAALPQLLPPLMYLAAPFQRGCSDDRHGYGDRLQVLLAVLAAPEAWCTLQDLTPLLKEAVSTRNVRLLSGLRAASARFRWPAVVLSPLLLAATGGGEEYDLGTVQQLLHLVADGWQTTLLASAVAAAAEKARGTPAVEARGLTKRMCDALCGSQWQLVAAAAVPLKLPAVAELLTRLYANPSSSSRQQQPAAAAVPTETPAAAALAAAAPAVAAAQAREPSPRASSSSRQQQQQHGGNAPKQQQVPARVPQQPLTSAQILQQLQMQQLLQQRARGQAAVVPVGGVQVANHASAQQQAAAAAAATLALLKGSHVLDLSGRTPAELRAMSGMMPPPAANRAGARITTTAQQAMPPPRPAPAAAAAAAAVAAAAAAAAAPQGLAALAGGQGVMLPAMLLQLQEMARFAANRAGQQRQGQGQQQAQPRPHVRLEQQQQQAEHQLQRSASLASDQDMLAAPAHMQGEEGEEQQQEAVRRQQEADKEDRESKRQRRTD